MKLQDLMVASCAYLHLSLPTSSTEKRAGMPRSVQRSLPRRPFATKRPVNRRANTEQRALPLLPQKRTGATRVRATDQPPPLGQRLMELLLALMTLILVANGLVGDRGLIQAAKVQQERQELMDSITKIRRQNRYLAQQAERLRKDSSAIEEIARGDLGLLHPGERVFIIKERTRPDLNYVVPVTGSTSKDPD